MDGYVKVGESSNWASQETKQAEEIIKEKINLIVKHFITTFFLLNYYTLNITWHYTQKFLIYFDLEKYPEFADRNCLENLCGYYLFKQFKCM